MIVYSKTAIDNLAIQYQAKSWLQKKLISQDEFQNICINRPTEYHDSNIFVRIGMFIFTCIIISSAFGLFAVLFQLKGVLFQLLLVSVVSIILTENFIKQRKFYRSGVTDAILYMGIACFAFSVIWIIDGNDIRLNKDPLIYLIPIVPFFIIASLRYVDAFLTLISYVTIFIINALIVLKAGNAGKLILPFESMLFSILIYYFIRRQISKKENRYIAKCLTMVEISSLCTLYLSGNYLIVRQLSELLLNAEIAPGSDIPFSLFFYTYTILIPLVYIVLGLRRKDSVLIRAGILLEIVGVLCIRYYYSFLSPEYAMTIAGIILASIAWISINYLKTPRFGITYEETDENRREAMQVLSSLVIAQATTEMRPPDGATKFGGGASGGGGAGGDF